MATKKPRVMVTMDPELYDLVATVARWNRKSMASVILDYVEGARPMLSHIATVAEAYEQDRAEELEVREVLRRRASERYKDEVERAMAVGQAMIDELAGQPVLGLLEPTSNTDVLEQSGGYGTDPQLCNTGVRLEDSNRGGDAGNENF